MIGNAAGIFDGDTHQAAGGVLCLKSAKALGQIDVRADGAEQVGADRGNIEGIEHDPALEKIDDLPRDLHGHIDLRIDGGGAQMRRADHLLKGKQRIVALRRLLGKDVDGRTGDPSAANRPRQSRLIDKSAGGAIEYIADPGLTRRSVSLLSRCWVSAFSGICRVIKSECASRCVEFDQVRRRSGAPFLRRYTDRKRSPASSDRGPLDNQSADLAGTDNAERFPRHFRAEKTIFFPLAGLWSSGWPREFAGPAPSAWQSYVPPRWWCCRKGYS